MDEIKSLKEAVLEGIKRLKGKNIKIIDLESIQHTECDYFIICSGNSNTHVDSIGHSVEEAVNEICDRKIIHREGYSNAIWVLLDYGDIMVHIFQQQARDFYNLEGLWADAKSTEIKED